MRLASVLVCHTHGRSKSSTVVVDEHDTVRVKGEEVNTSRGDGFRRKYISDGVRERESEVPCGAGTTPTKP